MFYDQDGDGSAESPPCDRGQRDLTVTLYHDADIIGNCLLETLPAPDNCLVMLDMADSDLPAGSLSPPETYLPLDGCR